jgi:hypothetical protein
VLRVWSLALALSAVLAASAERWPGPLPIRPGLVWALVVVPPLLMVLALVAGWSLPPGEAAPGALRGPAAAGDAAGQGRESDESSRENG